MKEKWALITGSSSGIGKEIAITLSNIGYHVILHGRNIEALHEIKKSITSNVEIINCDLTEKNAIEHFKALSEEKNIEVLVNNAGIGVDGDFKSTNIEEEVEMVEINVIFPMRLTKLILQNNKLKYILNTASLYSYFPVPKQAIYGASKAFLHSFSLAIAKENPEITISSLCPGLTYSSFRTRKGKEEKYYPIGLTSKAVATKAVRGMLNGKQEIVPGLFNKLISFVIPKLPTSLGLIIIQKMNSGRGY